jgi:hypothetical protein
VLTVLVDQKFVEPWDSSAVPKTFAFTFAQSKDVKHVVFGFTRSLQWAHVEDSLAVQLISVLRGQQVHRGDVFTLACNPQSGEVTACLRRGDELIDQITISDADNLISDLHRLFLTDQRYKHMFGRLCQSAVADGVDVPAACQSSLSRK